jgi:hypothetical protein
MGIRSTTGYSVGMSCSSLQDRMPVPDKQLTSNRQIVTIYRQIGQLPVNSELRQRNKPCGLTAVSDSHAKHSAVPQERSARCHDANIKIKIIEENRPLNRFARSTDYIPRLCGNKFTLLPILPLIHSAFPDHLTRNTLSVTACSPAADSDKTTRFLSVKGLEPLLYEARKGR